MTADLIRTFVPELEIRSAAKGGDGRTVEGLAVPYGRKQRINPELTEQFARGAFNHQVRAANRVMFSREHIAYGGVLIGRAVELRDDAAGLWGAWRVSKTVTGEETLELVRDGVLDELSVGFQERQNRREADGTITRVTANLVEVSVVLQGAYGRGATVEAVRAHQGGPCTHCGCQVSAAVEVRESGTDRLDQARQVLASLGALPAA